MIETLKTKCKKIFMLYAGLSSSAKYTELQ